MRKKLSRFLVILAAALVLAGCGAKKDDLSYEEKRAGYVPSIPYAEKLNADEEKADALLSEMKAEADQLYSYGTPYAIPDWDNTGFADTKLYQFCKALPKGADLHGHDDTMIPWDKFLDIMKDRSEICLEEGDLYGYMYASDNPDKPEGCVPIGKALEDGTLTIEEMRRILTMDGKTEDQRGWDVLSSHCFKVTLGIHTNRELYKDLYEGVFRSCYDNGVILAELRVLGSKTDEENLAKLEDIKEAYYRVRKDHPEFRVKVIFTANKRLKYEKEHAAEIFHSVLRVCDRVVDDFDPVKIEDFVIGLDLVSEEDQSRPLYEFTDLLGSEEVKNSGLKLFLHCGESLLMSNDFVIDAYLMGAERVGHAFNLYRNPELVKKFAEEKIAIEVCPISNFKLEYLSDLRLHPALGYMRSGIPVVICSDDGVYMTPEPLVDDFYAIILSWDLSLGDIKALCKNSITYSGLEKSETDELMTAWEGQWDAFIAGLIAD